MSTKKSRKKELKSAADQDYATFIDSVLSITSNSPIFDAHFGDEDIAHTTVFDNHKPQTIPTRSPILSEHFMSAFDRRMTKRITEREAEGLDDRHMGKGIPPLETDWYTHRRPLLMRILSTSHSCGAFALWGLVFISSISLIYLYHYLYG